MITKCKRQKKAMKTPLFTIIVPVYNAQNYIQHCMDSILGEDLKTTYDTCCAPFLYLAKNYEVIVVDDGSTDNTGVLLDNIAHNKDEMYVIHTKNYGVSHARNKALQQAKGTYILFLDADDYLLANWKQIVISAIKLEADLTIFDFVKKYDNGQEKKVSYNPSANQRKWCEKAFLISNQMNPCWSRLYKKSIIDTFQIKFDETMTSGEDFVFALDYFKYCNKVRFLHKPILYKEEQTDSVMHRISVEKYLADDAKMLAARRRYIKEKGSKKWYQNCVKLHFCAITNLLLKVILKSSKEEQEKYIHIICNHPHVKAVIKKLNPQVISVRKRLEYRLLNQSKRTLLLQYLRIKARFIRLKQDIE